MGANTYSMSDRQLDATAHGLGIACVKAAGNVCRADERKDLFIRGRAVDSKTLSEVTIDVHATHGNFASGNSFVWDVAFVVVLENQLRTHRRRSWPGP
jgi:hypothetical protein